MKSKMETIKKFMEGEIRVFGNKAPSKAKEVFYTTGSAAFMTIMVAVSGLSQTSTPPVEAPMVVHENDSRVSFYLKGKHPVTGQILSLNGLGTPEAVERVRSAVVFYNETGNIKDVRKSMHNIEGSPLDGVLTVEMESSHDINLNRVAVGFASINR